MTDVTMAEMLANPIYSRRLDSFPISKRTLNALAGSHLNRAEGGIRYVGELVRHDEMTLMGGTPNFGRRGMDEVREHIRNPHRLVIGVRIIDAPSGTRDQSADVLFRQLLTGGDIATMEDIWMNQNYRRALNSFSLSLPVRTALSKADILYSGELVTYSEQELLKIPGIDAGAVKEIKEKVLEPLHIKLGTIVPDYPHDRHFPPLTDDRLVFRKALETGRNELAEAKWKQEYKAARTIATSSNSTKKQKKIAVHEAKRIERLFGRILLKNER
ncbi:MAG TPA: DNA-directed RNA polymerase subunit alpha C-terminal domain-containing protein [Alphaproteobacteria bacterium]|nr:DNA-directed RNA polymerase subunit alpha C-terminal domain-containing protein [Alphaproteobacteria bacterium]